MDSNNMIVRLVNEDDCRPMWEWWNDPVTRQMMKDNNPVPYESHVEWFKKAIVDKNRVLCMGVFDGETFGIVRFLKEEDRIYEVSINLSPEMRGKGLGAPFLANSIKFLEKMGKISLLYAMLKKVNYPSKKTFEKNGFIFKEPNKIYNKMANFDTDNEFYCELKYRNGDM